MLLGSDQSAADVDRNSIGARLELMGELGVDAFAPQLQVAVAVLVAGPGDERRALLRERLGPVERLADVGELVAVDEVVAGMAARAEDDRVREVDR